MTGEKATDRVVAAESAPASSITYTQSKAYVLSALGGLFLIAAIRAFLFQFDHPDLFYGIVACILLGVMGALFWFPPKLVLTPHGVRGSSFGFVWLDVPWEAVEAISIFKTPVVQTMGAKTTGGSRAIGFNVKSSFKDRVRPKHGTYGYDAEILSMWDMPFERVADQCLVYWRAAGGGGELIDLLPKYSNDQLKLEG